MEYIYNLFTPESKKLIDLNHMDKSQNENTCMYFDYSNDNEKKTRTQISDFSDYRYNPDKKFKIKLYELDKERENIYKQETFNTFYYEKFNNSFFYIESNTSYHFKNIDGKLVFEIIDDESNIITKVSVNFKIHNDTKHDEDIICVIRNNFKLYMYLIRQNNDEYFYIRNIIYEKI